MFFLKNLLNRIVYIQICWLISGEISFKLNTAFEFKWFSQSKNFGLTLKIIQLSEYWINKFVSNTSTGTAFASLSLPKIFRNDCENIHAYLSDVWRFGLVVFSLERMHAWRIFDHTFFPEPLAANYKVRFS